MVIQIAAMKNIPLSYYEAAEIDGASKWVQFKSITFPLIKPILKIDAVLIITGSLPFRYSLYVIHQAEAFRKPPWVGIKFAVTFKRTQKEP